MSLLPFPTNYSGPRYRPPVPTSRSCPRPLSTSDRAPPRSGRHSAADPCGRRPKARERTTTLDRPMGSDGHALLVAGGRLEGGREAGRFVAHVPVRPHRWRHAEGGVLDEAARRQAAAAAAATLELEPSGGPAGDRRRPPAASKSARSRMVGQPGPRSCRRERAERGPHRLNAILRTVGVGRRCPARPPGRMYQMCP